MFSELEIELSASTAALLSQLMLHNNVEVVEKEDLQKYTSLVQRQEKLAELWM